MLKLLYRFDRILVFLAPLIGLLFALVFLFTVEEKNIVAVLPLHGQVTVGFWLNAGLSLIFIFGAFIYLNRLTQTQAILGQISNLPVFIAWTLSLWIFNELPPFSIWLVMLLILFYYGQLLFVFDEYRLDASVFNAAFIVGLCSLFYFGLSVFLLPVVVALMQKSRLSIKRVLKMLFGFLTPAYLMFAVNFLLFDTVSLPVTFEAVDLIKANWFRPDILLLIAGAGVAIWFVWVQLSRSTIRERKRWYLILISAICGVICTFLMGQTLGAVLLIPMTWLIVKGLMGVKKWWMGEIILWLIFTSIFIDTIWY